MTTINPAPINRTWGTLELQSPLVQSYPGSSNKRPGGDNVIRTRTWKLGEHEIPVISGDSMRGRMRRALAFDLLERIGVSPGGIPDVETAHVLFVGGPMRKDPAHDLRPRLDGLRNLIPSIGLLGGSLLGDYASGCLRMGHWVAQCAETPSVCLLGEPTDDELAKLPSADTLLIHESMARNGSELFDFYDRSTIDQQLSGAKGEGEDDGAGAQAITMPHSYWAVAPGTRFAGWAATASYRGQQVDNALMRSCLRHAIDIALPAGQEITLGLRASNGYGVAVVEWDGLDDFGSPDVYLGHVEDNAAEIFKELVDVGLKSRTREAKAEEDKKRREVAKAAKAEKEATAEAAADPAPDKEVSE